MSVQVITTPDNSTREIHVDTEGFLTEFDDWDEALGEVLAANIGLSLTEDHRAVVKFLRDDYVATGETATLRRVSTVGGFPTKQLYQLFPKKPAKKMAYVSGLPKPKGCI